MKKTIITLIIIALTATIMLASGQKREARNVSEFTGINASGSFEIIVTKGNSVSLHIEADEEIMQYIHSKVQGGVLQLYIDNNKKTKNIKILRAFVVMKNLEQVTLSGACSLTTRDIFTPTKFKSDCCGATSMILNLDTQQLNIDASGTSKINVKANVKQEVKIDISGVSKFYGELNAASVTCYSSAVSFINLQGSANDLRIDLSGTSCIDVGNFVTKNAIVGASGVSNVTVNAKEQLKISASGMSSVTYIGSPKVSIDCSETTIIKNINY